MPLTVLTGLKAEARLVKEVIVGLGNIKFYLGRTEGEIEFDPRTPGKVRKLLPAKWLMFGGTPPSDKDTIILELSNDGAQFEAEFSF